MDAADLKSLSALLDDALDLPPEERAGWLAALPPPLRRLEPALRSMLEAGAVDLPRTLDRRPLFGSEAASAGVEAGGIVGPYRLLQPLGEGGMAEVWLAERADGQLRRRVALKLPQIGWIPGLAERFAREREILASLEHAHIARLYDAGLDAAGRPYLAMEYVQGRPIDVYARERGLSVQDRLRLLLQVADAVAFAHSRLVLHRDLKPANILVTEGGDVRLLDFGIAKLMADGRAEETALTRASGRALTLDYASPEQIAGHPVGTASDVYSLGVVAYELLAGARPYRLRRGSAAELEEAILGADIALASRTADDAAARRALRGDLDAILQQALRKAPAERYASVALLAQDWRRHMEGEHVLARPDSWGRQAARFARRRRVPLAAAGLTAGAFGLAFGAGAIALVIGVLLAGLGAAWWQAGAAREQARRARVAAETAEAVQSFLQGIFLSSRGDQADPVRARRRPAVELLDEGVAQLDAKLGHAPAAKIRVLETLADVYTDMASFERATQLRREQLRLVAGLDGESSVQWVIAATALADALAESADAALAQPLLDRAARAAERLPAGGEAGLALDLALAALHNTRRDPAGVAPAERALAALRGRDPHGRLARALFLFGKACMHAGRLDEAQEALRESIDVGERLGRGRATTQLDATMALGRVERDRGRFDAADAAMRRAQALAVAVHGDGSFGHVATLGSYAVMLTRIGRPGEALRVLAQARDAAERWVDDGERGPNLGHLLQQEMQVASSYGQAGRVETLYAALRAAAADADASPEFLFALGSVAMSRIERGDFPAAGDMLDRMEALIAAHDLGRSEHAFMAPRRRVAWLLAQDRIDEAEARWRALEDPLSARFGQSGAVVHGARIALARGLWAEAEAAAVEALARLDRVSLQGRRASAVLQSVVSRSRCARDDAAAAGAAALEAVGLLEPVVDLEFSVWLADAQVAAGAAAAAANDLVAARRWRDRARAIHARHDSVGPQFAAPLQQLEAALAARPP